MNVNNVFSYAMSTKCVLISRAIWFSGNECSRASSHVLKPRCEYVFFPFSFLAPETVGVKFCISSNKCVLASSTAGSELLQMFLAFNFQMVVLFPPSSRDMYET